METSKDVDLLRVTPQERSKQKDRIVQEIPLTILLNGQELVTLQCTPDRLEDLAIGFLLSEGILQDRSTIEGINLNEKGWFLRVEIEEGTYTRESFSQKRVISSGCAGGKSFYRASDMKDCSPLNSSLRVSAEKIFCLMGEFQKKSPLFKNTGGVHSSALCHQERIEIFAEDIGRHNAVDKIFGKCFRENISLDDKFILTSGRISSEILIKVAKRKIPVLVSRSAPTDLAVNLAEKLNVTLVGFVRGSRMNVYSHNFRVI